MNMSTGHYTEHPKKNTRNSGTVRMTLEEAQKRKHIPYPGELSPAELAALPDETIDYSDLPELTEEFWKNAQLVMPRKKKAIGIRIDDDLLAWFKKQGKGYQSHINAVLRAYVFSRKD